MRHYNIAVMPADGIGPEVITEGVAVLRAVAELHGGVKFEITGTTGARSGIFATEP